MELESELGRAAALIEQADGLLITAGAGMGIDSGLPDFRGKNGFWKAYPALGKNKIRFEEIASPHAFDRHPRLAWGFYGHRLNLYRNTVPHKGFTILKEIASRLPHGCFVFTSNVDGQFQTAGFSEDRICEVHGSIHHLQCMDGCEGNIWSAKAIEPVIDESNCLMTNDPPICNCCGELARPNILMFNDWMWLNYRKQHQAKRLDHWLTEARSPVIVEIGAGTAIPTVRRFGEQLGIPMIRINPIECRVLRAGDVALPMNGLAALQAVRELLTNH